MAQGAASRTESRTKAGLRSVMRATGLLGVWYRILEIRIARRWPKPPTHGPDGLPMPGRLEMTRIGGGAASDFFFERGKATAEALVALAVRAGADPKSWTRVFDWGCGCGRLSRHMPALTPATIVGRDIDGMTVRWSARHLPGDYKPCKLLPPLDIASNSIDFAYGFSVLTHLTARTQKLWFRELGRILRPGAIATLTFHDREHFASTAAPFRREESGVAVTEWALEGSNMVAAFQDLDTIAAAANEWFELVGSQTSREAVFEQAVAVLRRR